MSHLVLALVCYCQVAAALWPIPTDLTVGTTALKLSPGFEINLNVPNAPSDLQAAVTRTNGFLHQDKLQRLVVGRGADDTPQVNAAKSLSSLTISISGTRKVQSISQEAILPWEARSESYSLTVPSDGSGAVLTAASTLGLFRGPLNSLVILYLLLK
jgi:hexosaminidase